MPLASLDWALPLAAAIGAVPATLAAVLSALTRREVKTTNGVTLGRLVEHTHDLAEVAATEVQKVVVGEVEPPHGINNAKEEADDGAQAGPENN